MKVKYWCCPNCGNNFINKPDHCFLKDQVLWPCGLVSGCGKEKYPLKEMESEITSAKKSWCTYAGLVLVIDGNKDLYFRGSNADIELDKFVDYLKSNNIKVQE